MATIETATIQTALRKSIKRSLQDFVDEQPAFWISYSTKRMKMEKVLSYANSDSTYVRATKVLSSIADDLQFTLKQVQGLIAQNKQATDATFPLWDKLKSSDDWVGLLFAKGELNEQHAFWTEHLPFFTVKVSDSIPFIKAEDKQEALKLDELPPGATRYIPPATPKQASVFELWLDDKKVGELHAVHVMLHIMFDVNYGGYKDRDIVHSELLDNKKDYVSNFKEAHDEFMSSLFNSWCIWRDIPVVSNEAQEFCVNDFEEKSVEWLRGEDWDDIWKGSAQVDYPWMFMKFTECT